MSDFPSQQPGTSLFVHTTSMYGVAQEAHAAVNTGGYVSTTWVANFGVYQPVVIPWPYLVSRVFWENGATLTGPPSADFGIYTQDGTRIYSIGPTVQSGTSTLQFVSVATPFVLAPGRYYFGWSSSGSSALVMALAPSTIALSQCGVLQQASVATLPATATFASPTQALLPLCGITRTTTGY